MSASNTKSFSRNAPPKADPKACFYFLHGDDEAAIENFRRQIVEACLTAGEREENYREFVPPAGASTLRHILGEIMSELSTVSLLPGARRVVTLYTIQDFFEARAKGGAGRSARTKTGVGGGAAIAGGDTPKTTPSMRMAKFIETELPSLDGMLIVIAIEDYEKWKRISPSNPVVALARKQETLHAFRQTSAQFAFFDALFARNTQLALTLWREWVQRAAASPKPYYALTAQLRLLIEAKTAVSSQLQSRGISRVQFEKEFMPAEPDKNLFALKPDFRRDKLLRSAANFTFPELLTAYEKLAPLQKYAIPLASDTSVPDRNLLAELWIIGFTVKCDRRP
ncbi:MAG: hypothetical protein NTY46_07000 [Candidatus Sumerlaeota bacterium]|nr:hypothetical protein [Candidatus Sumerlaeota bacterium]